MTVREILETLDREVSDSKARTIRIQAVIERIRTCVKEEPAPAATKRRRRGPAKEGVIRLCQPEETRAKRAA